MLGWCCSAMIYSERYWQSTLTTIRALPHKYLQSCMRMRMLQVCEPVNLAEAPSDRTAGCF